MRAALDAAGVAGRRGRLRRGAWHGHVARRSDRGQRPGRSALAHRAGPARRWRSARSRPTSGISRRRPGSRACSRPCSRCSDERFRPTCTSNAESLHRLGCDAVRSRRRRDASWRPAWSRPRRREFIRLQRHQCARRARDRRRPRRLDESKHRARRASVARSRHATQRASEDVGRPVSQGAWPNRGCRWTTLLHRECRRACAPCACAWRCSGATARDMMHGAGPRGSGASSDPRIVRGVIESGGATRRLPVSRAGAQYLAWGASSTTRRRRSGQHSMSAALRSTRCCRSRCASRDLRHDGEPRPTRRDPIRAAGDVRHRDRPGGAVAVLGHPAGGCDGPQFWRVRRGVRRRRDFDRGRRAHGRPPVAGWRSHCRATV